MGIDIDDILREEAYLLARDSKAISIKEFLEIAKKTQLRQTEWTYFWKLIRNEIQY